MQDREGREEKKHKVRSVFSLSVSFQSDNLTATADLAKNQESVTKTVNLPFLFSSSLGRVRAKLLSAAMCILCRW